MSELGSRGHGSSAENPLNSGSNHPVASSAAVSFSLTIFMDATLALLGLALSAYALRHHLSFKAGTSADAVCNVSDRVSCDAVAASQYSEIAGVPLGVFGIAFFAVLLILNIVRTASARSGFLGRMASQSHAVLVASGIVVSLTLAGISLFVVKSFCLVCSGIYATCILLAVSLHLGRAQLARPFRLVPVVAGLSVAAVVTAISAFSYLEFTKAGLTRQPTLDPQSAQTISSPNSAASLAFPQQPARAIPLSRTAYAGAGEDFRYGNEQAKVIIHEFVDFQCPGCAVLATTIKTLKERYGSRVLFVFRNYPLDQTCNKNIRGKFHDHSCFIASMARCAGQYGKFWEYQELAFSGQSSASVENAEKWAKAVGLSQEAIATCKKSADILNKLKDDVDVADSIGVTGTPAIFINGANYNGDRSVDGLSAAIEAALGQVR